MRQFNTKLTIAPLVAMESSDRAGDKYRSNL